MSKQTIFRLVTVVVTAILLALVGAPAAFAQPANDNFDNAIVIGAMPFSDVVNTTDATTEAGEPQFCNFMSQTVWYSFTATAAMVLKADNVGTGFITNLNVYQATGPGFGGLSFVGCGGAFPVTFSAQAGTTFYIQTGILFGAVGDLHVNLQEVPPPPNDDFANAVPIGGLPFSDTQDLTGATVEAGEPAPCFGTSNTVWYAFTPDTTQSITATHNVFGAGIAAYTGSSLPSLSRVGCAAIPPLTFRAQAGTTYWFQVGAWCCSGFGPVTFHLDVAPNPVARFSYSPPDPSSFDTIQFFDNSFDPAGVGFSSQAWDFGDGATATGCCPTHRYAADGDYTVELTVTTADDRTASTSQVVQVRTHDVSIVRMILPASAHVGQTIAINVYVRNTHYPETVRVDLSRSIPGGFSGVGSLTQLVLVKMGGQSTRFAFTYTVTGDDAAVGKITFRADAIIIGQRDALPGDNELLSTPVKIV